MLKRIFSFALAVLLLCGMLPQMGVQADATAYTLDAQQVDGRSFSTVYAEKLNHIFRGEVALFSNSGVRLPLGTSMKTGTSYTIANTISGYQCYIYAQGVYYYLFGDVVYHGNGYKYWSNSEKVLTNKKSVSYDLFVQAGVGFGAYIRTTTSTSGAYNGENGHSMIVLAYDEAGITFLEGNADGRGLIRITEMTWDEFNVAQLSGRGRRISHVVQCVAAACRHTGYSGLGVCQSCGVQYDFEQTYTDDCQGYYIVSGQEGAVLKADLPYTEAEDLFTFAQADQVEVLGSVTNAFGETWYKVLLEGQIGYISAQLLTRDTVTPGKPILRHNTDYTDATPAVFTWTATANTTHYDLLLQVKDDGENWQEHAYLSDTASGVEVELSEGEYRAELRAYNAEAPAQDGADGLYTPADAAYLTVAHSHVYETLTTVQATCTASGMQKYICAECADIYTETIPTKAHNYVDLRCTVCNAEEQTPFGLNISADAATGKPSLSWKKISGGKKYEVYRATSKNGKYTKLTSTTKLTYTDSKASVGTKYFYKIRAVGVKNAYNGQYSEIIACQCVCARPSVTVTADAATGKPKLTWKAVTGAQAYQISRRLPGEEQFAVVAEPTGKSYLDSSAPVDIKCEYRVKALDTHAGADSALTKVLQVTSVCARPAVKADLTAEGKPLVTWQKVDGALQYRIYRSTSATKNFAVVETVDTLFYADTTASVGKTYYYKVVAVGETSESARSTAVKAACRCAAPELDGKTAASGKPVLSWNKISGAKKYEIYRAVDGGSFKKLTTTTKTSYTDSKATGGREYTYKIRALGAKSSYNSPYSNMVSIDVACSAPSVTVKVDTVTGRPSLSWKKVTGAVSYEVYRSENGGEYLCVSTQKSLSYKDSDAIPGTKYSYKVVALGKQTPFHSGFSAAKAVSAVCAQPKPKGKIGSDGKPVIIWGEVEGAQEYAIYRSTSKSKGYVKIDETEDLTFADTTAKKNKTYYYKIVALSGNTQSARSGYVKLKAKK